MSEISKAYTPGEVETSWYARWCDSGCFTADPSSSAPAYSIVIPPPNVTGILTLGHVLNNTLQDILARRARQTGHEVLWLPGTDHAGIATQTVVERQLRKEEKKTRHDLGREAFLAKVWEWKEKHGGIIISQLKKLGASCDWSRERFTMDEAYARKVQEVFVDLHGKGLIYRGKRMVNWCPVSLTALSDEEVIPKKQKGYLYHFKLEVVESPGTWLEIATTRPETIMGDTAVAVNPKDERYAHLIGKHVRRPLPLETEYLLPIIGDEAVDFEFGTGVLKVTPAHDKADHEIGLRHNLPVIDIMNPDGTLNELAGEGFVGLDRFEARAESIERLKELGLLVKEEPHENNVGFSERADVPIEPRLSEQWFLKYPKTVEARDAVRDGLIRFFPDRWEKVYDHWLGNIQDWCISRQLWWGHRIPVWYAPLSSTSGSAEGIRVQIESPGEGWTQDPDVLDTWFSSWLWAHDTMDDAVRAKFYPTSVLVTGPDIIFFWVARMIMAGLEYTGEIPFRDVYFTGIIRDKSGRKMSKSLGNSPDPLDLIAKYGADGLRFGIIRVAPQGQDIKFDEKQIEEGRNFANKLWNACRFREMQGPCDPAPNLSKHELPDIALDVLAKFDTMHAALREAYAGYRFHEVAGLLYDFFWGDYCDWFVEAAKPILNGTDAAAKAAILAVMDTILSGFLRLLHPLMPHITEELWARLGFQAPVSASGTGERAQFLLYTAPPVENLLATAAPGKAASAQKRVAALYGAVHAARNLRAEFKLPTQQQIRLLVLPKEPLASETLAILGSLTRASEVTVITEAPAGTPSLVTDLGTLFLPLEGLVDLDAERTRISGEITKVEAEIAKVGAKLADPNFTEKVPPAVLEEHRERQAKWTEKLDSLKATLQTLG
jgi:valyl-tRNA synthetase